MADESEMEQAVEAAKEAARGALFRRHAVFWFDLGVPQTEGCYGWHRCSFEGEHEGDHMCADGHFCPQSDY